MAHSLSAKKRIRQNEKRRLRNRARRSALKTEIRRFLDAVGAGNPEQARECFRQVCRRLDREADRGLIHRNNAARRKSRLARRLAALSGPAAG